jgi:hypothetical protein
MGKKKAQIRQISKEKKKFPNRQIFMIVPVTSQNFLFFPIFISECIAKIG